MVHVRGLEKRFEENEAQVLKGITFSVPRTGSLAIVGPSGCGKTTLLYILAGLITPSAGSVIIHGREVCTPSKRTSFILQDFGLLPWRTVGQNVCLGMKIQGRDKKSRIATSERILAEFGLLEHRDRYPGSLSGGEKQRIAIGRALATDPELLLMDEPFSSLDALTREMLQNTLLSLWKQKGLTTILVTHSVEEAVFLGCSILVLSQRPASIKGFVPNPGAGRLEFREEAGFHETCKRVRRLIEN